MTGKTRTAKKAPAKRAARRTKPKAVRRKAIAPRAAAVRALGSDPFAHVVVLMLENRSFDHMLGALRLQIPGLDGLPEMPPWRINKTFSGVYEQRPGAAPVVDPDPKHENKDVLEQLQKDNGNFVMNFVGAYPETTRAQREQVMLVHDADQLAAMHPLARASAVCNRWFASVPGPTWTNRLFAMSGTSLGRVKMPESAFHLNLHRYPQPSVFRRLDEAGRDRYRIYAGDVPLALLLEDRRTLAARRHFADMRDFLDDAAGDADAFPEFAFIEPSYLGDDADDDHPPHDVSRGEALIAEVYGALHSNPKLFENTLLVITFDEHGGFYDHVAPPEAVPPDGEHEEYDFRRYGVRVPALLVSPRIAPQVVATRFDHTSVLRYLQIKWGLGPMGDRVAGAAPVLEGVALVDPGSFELPQIALPEPLAAVRALRALRGLRAPAGRLELTDLERSIVLLSIDLEAPAGVLLGAPRSLPSLREFGDPRQLAIDRVRAFLGR